MFQPHGGTVAARTDCILAQPDTAFGLNGGVSRGDFMVMQLHGFTKGPRSNVICSMSSPTCTCLGNSTEGVTTGSNQPKILALQPLAQPFMTLRPPVLPQCLVLGCVMLAGRAAGQAHATWRRALPWA